MGPGYEDLGAFRRLADFDDIAFDALADAVRFRRDLFRCRQDGFGLAQVDVDVAVLDALDDTGDDVVRSVRKFIIDDVPFGFAQALDHDLFGSLGGDAAEIVRHDIDVDDVADFIIDINEAGLIEGDFRMGIFDFIDDGLGSLDGIVARRTVQFDFSRRVGIGFLLVGRNQDGFQGVADDIRRYAFLLG